MLTPDDEYPWVFGRDEIDLLEDEIEDLFSQYGAGSDQNGGVEVHVLKEQIETEEKSDEELSARLGMNFLESTDRPERSKSFDERQRSPQRVGNMRMHPFYQKARLWAVELRKWAKHSYENGGAGTGDVFRIYANVNLVPIKLFTALHEEQHGDQIGLEVAEQEYQLAQTYLERILESLTVVLIVDETFGDLVTLRSQAEELRAIVIGQLAEVRRRKKNL